MIPDGWTVKRFAEIARYKAGRTPARANADYWKNADDGVPWVAISDMDAFDTIMSTKEKITQTAFDKVFRRQAMPAGTLIMSFKLTIGRIATLGIDACHNEAIISIFPNQGIDQRYLGYFLAQADYNMLQDRQVKGNTLNQEKIDRIEIWLPPISEQSSIADILDLVRRSIHIQEQAFISSCNLKRSVMHTLFTRGLRGEAQKKTEIGPIPQSWDVGPLGNHFSIISGGTPSRKNPAFWIDGTIPWVKTTEINYDIIHETEECITQSGLDNSTAKLLPSGSLLLAMYGQGATRGKVATLGVEAACNQACAAIHTADDIIDVRYLYHFLSFRYREIRKLAHGGQQQNLNLNIIRSFLMAHPPHKHEQKKIVAILDTIDRKINLHRRRRAVFDDLFKTLLHKLMTGQIRAADLDIAADRTGAEDEKEHYARTQL